ncbi:hyaluronan mediated motility receptor [Holotrichia oblita]|uniref:Hyaluronan mediated motility receptor n=1 Tax=Holotrichia oblita TaxID=644536 RepID=A0ACB9T6Z6_HOLOL|nr:hyaluronan mediated motility receptor [Holotrichia oblita]
MSFPRAKLQRFNEIHNCTPSPADYNPKIKSHVAGVAVSTTERFMEHKSPAVSDISINSLNSTTCFRTPTLPKKKRAVTPSLSKVKSANIFKETNLDNDALSDKIVECSNKDLYINDLLEQIEDMKLQLNQLKLQKDDLKTQKIKFETLLRETQDDHKIEIENVNTKHKNELILLQMEIENVKINLELAKKECDEFKSQNPDEKYGEIIEQIKEEYELKMKNLHDDHYNEHVILKEHIMKIKNEMIMSRNEWDKMRTQNRQDIEELLEHISKFQKLNGVLIQTYNEEIKTKEEIIDKEVQTSLRLENELKLLKESHRKEIDELKLRHKKEIEDIEYEMLKTITESHNKLERDKKSLEDAYKSKIINLENNHKETVTKIRNQTDLQIKQIEEDCKTANQLTEARLQEQYKDIENEWRIKIETHIKHAEKLIDEQKEINEFNLTQYKVEKDHLQKDFDEKIEDIENKWKIKLEQQIKESDEILKECQAISEYNIIQCELEKNDAKRILLERLNELEETKELNNKYLLLKNEMENLYTQLKSEHDNTLTNLATIQEELSKERELRQHEAQQTLAEKHTFEITISKTRKAVEALTKRLFDSDRDVEQLKLELEECEKAKLQNEDKCNKLAIELDTMKKLYEDTELQNESNLILCQDKIEKVRKDLYERVDRYKGKSVKVLEETKEMKEHLHQQQTLNSEAQHLISKLVLEFKIAKHKILKLEKINEELKGQLKEQMDHNQKIKIQVDEESALKNEEIQSLIKQMNQLQDKYDSYYQYCEYYKCKVNQSEKEIEELNVIQKNYIDQSGKYDELLQKYEGLLQKNAELTNTIAQQESLIAPFRDQLEAYEVERAALLNQKHDAENEAKLMGMKYAQILGHQNQNQKIKHLEDLKRKNFELIENKNELELKTRVQAKTIEKLRKKIAMLTKTPKKASDDKENLNNSSLNGSLVFSPLRDMN